MIEAIKDKNILLKQYPFLELVVYVFSVICGIVFFFNVFLSIEGPLTILNYIFIVPTLLALSLLVVCVVTFVANIFLYIIDMLRALIITLQVAYLRRKKPSQEEVNSISEEYASLFTEEELNLFSGVSMQVSLHMRLASFMLEDKLLKVNKEQKKRFFAFELGIIEFFDASLLNIDRSEIGVSDAKFLNFLKYYALCQYQSGYEVAYDFWLSICPEDLFLKERELGWDSVKNRINPDGTTKENHFPAVYLQKAVGISF